MWVLFAVLQNLGISGFDGSVFLHDFFVMFVELIDGLFLRFGRWQCQESVIEVLVLFISRKEFLQICILLLREDPQCGEEIVNGASIDHLLPADCWRFRPYHSREHFCGNAWSALVLSALRHTFTLGLG